MNQIMLRGFYLPSLHSVSLCGVYWARTHPKSVLRNIAGKTLSLMHNGFMVGNNKNYDSWNAQNVFDDTTKILLMSRDNNNISNLLDFWGKIKFFRYFKYFAIFQNFLQKKRGKLTYFCNFQRLWGPTSMILEKVVDFF